MEELGINLPVLLTQLVTFIILLVLLRVAAYKPLMRMLDERSKQSMEQAEALKEQTSRGEEEVKKQLETASREGQERIARAVKAGEEMKDKAKAEAKVEAEALLARARAEIQHERDEAIGEVRREFGDLTILAAEKVIDRSLDKKEHQELIDKVLEESTKKE